jgi:S-adenosylmethionine synthetase
MFGYACNETAELMPLPIYYAHRIMQRQAEVRKTAACPGCARTPRASSRSKYVDGKPVAIDTVVVSTQHDPDVSHAQISPRR